MVSDDCNASLSSPTERVFFDEVFSECGPLALGADIDSDVFDRGSALTAVGAPRRAIEARATNPVLMSVLFIANRVSSLNVSRFSVDYSGVVKATGP